ncbi:MAG: metallophosphoesterase family protein [Leptolyngbyaceae cyanobacterium bins.59]|nr:metallophosphoesterase family protein [Leptolyngbyaceae cyanobacterium bins.59]
MASRSIRGGIWLAAIGFVLALVVGLLLQRPQLPPRSVESPSNPVADLQLLTDPFLQLPTPSSVRVVWFTEFPGDRHTVAYGEGFSQTVAATTTQLTRTREDSSSKVGIQTGKGELYSQTTSRPIWRHEAEVKGLPPNQRVPYRVVSAVGDRTLTSDPFTLAPSPTSGKALKILLTSDHQLMPMTATNLQKVVETVGQVDGVFLAGDLVNIPDRASEWFDDNRGGAFFPCLQGRASYELERNGKKTRYRGGALIQHAPLFPATGNHEVMGIFSKTLPLNEQYNGSRPRDVAAALYQAQAKQINLEGKPEIQASWIQDQSFNVTTYNELFTLPPDPSGGNQYYAVTFGDIRLVSLYITNIWRVPFLDPKSRGRYREREEDFTNSEAWGYGQHLFEPIAKGSQQYNWLVNELNSPAFQQAKYRIVMFHHPPHSLGDNIVPAYTDPVQTIERDAQNKITAIRYEYPLEQDYIIRDVLPLLETAKVQLVLYGHSHIWNRFVSPSGMHFLETSNVGNSYGAAWGDKKRVIPEGFRETYVATGDPNGLEPVMPTIAPFKDDQGNLIPYLASNDITAFSILETDKGTVTSYAFDTREPDSKVVKFDEFTLR